MRSRSSRRFGIPAIYKRLLQRWLERLAAAGMLRAVGGKFVSAADRCRIRIWLPAFARQNRHSRMIPICSPIFATAAKSSHNIMAGKESPLETLFPGGSSTLAERLYAGANINRYVNAIAGAAVEAAARASKANRPFRILEVGAGTGGTSATILPLLDPDRCAYVFSDVSDLFLIARPPELRSLSFRFFCHV